MSKTTNNRTPERVLNKASIKRIVNTYIADTMKKKVIISMKALSGKYQNKQSLFNICHDSSCEWDHKWWHICSKFMAAESIKSKKVEFLK